MLKSFSRGIQAQTQRASTITVAAPTGGWNARDALGAMDPLDAVTLENWWPGTNSVILRNGYTKWATGFAGQVETIMVYNGPTASKMFAISSGEIYDITAGGVIGAASVTGLTNSRWQYVNMTTSGGSYLVAVNGLDDARFFDGTSWHTEGTGAPYNWSGITSDQMNNITVFKNRIWLIQNDSLRASYGPVDSIGGTFQHLEMRGVMQKGGYLVAAMTWTLDAGYGMDDYLAFISSEGEVAVWKLDDPTSVSGIALIGVYQLGTPIGKRCYIKYGGDLLIITQDGVVPMSGSLQSSRLDPRVSITNKIQFAVSQAISSYSTNFGWQLLYFPKENQLYLNVPISEGANQQQYVQNNITQSWCQFTGWNANCWEIFEDNPYFGGSNYVGKAWDGYDDAGSIISAFGLQSFQSYGSALQKQIRMIRFHLFSSGEGQAVYGNVNVDYDLTDTTSPIYVTIGSALWGSGTWDSSVWGAGTTTPSAEWQGATSIGYTFAPVVKSTTKGLPLQWIAADVLFEVGGVL